MQEYERRGYLNQDFKIFHIVDQKDTQYEPHFHDFHKIILFLQGNVTYQIEGQSYALSPYDIVLVKAGDIHRPIVHDTSVYERFILYISDEFLRSMEDQNNRLDYCFRLATDSASHVLRIDPSSDHYQLIQMFEQLEKNIYQKEHPYGFDDSLPPDAPLSAGDYVKDACFELYPRLLLAELLIHLNRAALGNQIQFIGKSSSNNKIHGVIEYLSTHLEEDLSIDRLAEHFFTSKFHLMRTFKEETGYTIYHYLTMKRLHKAHAMIGTGPSLTEICFSCGFRNYSTFFRAYKKYYGIAPEQSK